MELYMPHLDSLMRIFQQAKVNSIQESTPAHIFTPPGQALNVIECFLF